MQLRHKQEGQSHLLHREELYCMGRIRGEQMNKYELERECERLQSELNKRAFSDATAKVYAEENKRLILALKKIRNMYYGGNFAHYDALEMANEAVRALEAK